MTMKYWIRRVLVSRHRHL